VAAEGRTFAIDRFAVSIRVHPDASLTVREDITFDFRGRHNGIIRTTPIRETRGGLDWTMRVDDVLVFVDPAAPLRTEVSYPGRYVRIKAWLPEAVDATKRVTLLYRVRRGLLAWADLDEPYWNVTGTEWDVTIGSAEATVELPEAVPDSVVRTIGYTGPAGVSSGDYVETRGEHSVSFRTTRALRPREGLTIVAGWPPGLIARPSAWREAWWWLVDNWPLGLPVLTLVAMFSVWRVYGRDPDANRSIRPEYEPPPGLAPAEAGGLVDERAEPRDVIASIVDLAVRGYLQIEHVPTAFGTPDFLFKRLKPVVGDPALKPLELFVLGRIFGADWALNLRLLSEVRRDYDNVFPPIREAIYRTMVADGLFHLSPEAVKTVWWTVGGDTLHRWLPWAIALASPSSGSSISTDSR
jgi:hypothetical protein